VKVVKGIDVATPFPRLSFAEAMRDYGSDKPDRRFEMKLADVAEVARASEFRIFRQATEAGGHVRGLKVPGGKELTRKDLDTLTAFAADFGAKGLAWMRVEAEGLTGPIAKFFKPDQLAAMQQTFAAKEGDLLLFVADEPAVVAASLGALRVHLGHRLGIVPQEELNFCWVTDFPLFEWDVEAKRHVAIHHPFTSPRREDLDRLESEPLSVRARAYDLVLNGVELGGGSIRIHRREVQQKVFSLLGIGPEEAQEKFEFLLEALRFGAPPHGGIAFGFDRWAMMLAGMESLRDVIAFPKTTRAVCPLTDAPGTVSDAQLDELSLLVKPPLKKDV